MTAVMPTSKAKIGAYIDHDLKDALEALAALESRSISNYVEILVKAAVAKAKSEGRLQ